MDWRKSYEDGVAAYKAKDYQKCVRLLNESLNLGGKRFAVLDARAAVFEKLLEHDKAMRDCKDCIVLDPKSNKPYLRASRICEARQQPEKALKFLKHAIQVTPASLLDPLRKRLPALQKLVDALQPEIPRVDPIAVLPEEVLVAVMEMVITEDPKMAPRFSWVSRTWREMTINCPFLWRQIRLNGSRYNQVSKRLHIYGQRGQGKLDLIQIDNIPPEYEPLVHAVRPFLDRVKTLRIRCDTVQAIGEFIYALRGTCNHLEELAVVLGRPVALGPQMPSQIHLGLASPMSSSTLRKVRLVGLSFLGMGHDRLPAETYEQLECIILEQCKIQPDRSMSPLDDVVHRTLFNAKQVKRLELRNNRFENGLVSAYSEAPILLDKLETLVIPSPFQSTVDIAAPHITRLSLAQGSPATTTGEGALRQPVHRGLLPSLKQFAPAQIPVSQLQSLEIAVNDNDKSAALKSWLMRLEKITDLGIISHTDCREDGAPARMVSPHAYTPPGTLPCSAAGDDGSGELLDPAFGGRDVAAAKCRKPYNHQSETASTSVARSAAVAG
ncbi:hypothetical protein NliqN6_4260 [Naganishia liquefaciens]|uniref:F-box domain-containing protein n=1 Tax=Naganishia liquefaciens TaxID=104408 RepID=A0A8H3TVW9_9TREE|nr:hypothetical protein NliqN6_4260 [Naganishia liquefaciens]